MNIPTKSRHHNLKQAQQFKLEEREVWHKLVVKILNWKSSPGGQISKITPKEWATYCQKVLKTNIITGKQKSKQNLKETLDIIKRHGGFA